ncbi:phosphatidic acid phosphatase type 2/haloperoxidase [Piptocephalis cylindrospora]|uniref:Phosphatidic acid phosphatase type 2/haloperoxidase n=1 Tax=Piptocephalis cylindrospora TaxID=1907219 RepID=A0A4P9Y512_9FUNG|nr:phosphatidic acid phosphatase type 2/haloperoxidase [Piptocephalis cylindrospora]|eukprot:RKP14015.1 phosphatidic acid phosphatase type 2/haloperoxidase [Piptocephalis cylindrospora]
MAVFNWKRTRSHGPSYLIDWLVVLMMAIAWFLIGNIPPFQRKFSIQDKTIMYPHAYHETVTSVHLGLICFLLPIVAITLVALLVRRSSWDWHVGILGLCTTMTLTLAVTHTLKVSVGRLRPDFLDRCQPREGTVDPAIGLLSIADVCTQTNESMLRDGSKSFPSGHSSETFAGLTYLALYFAGKLNLFDRQGRSIKGFIVLLPILGASLVAVSRLDDYRHHWQDITVGTLIGIFFAYFGYRQYYPSLTDCQCARPFPLREMSRRARREEAVSPQLEYGGQVLPLAHDPRERDAYSPDDTRFDTPLTDTSPPKHAQTSPV